MTRRTSWEEIVEEARILIVDDEEAGARVMERMLAKAGYTRITSTTDPRRVATLYREINPDLIILDLMMPHLNGYQVMDLLSEEIGPETYLPILVITADLDNATRLRSLLAGAKDFLNKPIDPVEAMLRIRILLETRFLFRSLTRAGDSP